MINLNEFVNGVSEIVNISKQLLSKLFDVIDENKIGMIDFEKFDRILRADTPSQIPEAKFAIEDSFIW